jgi:FlaA1/EpsC-like NDP-sugar epimerase
VGLAVAEDGRPSTVASFAAAANHREKRPRPLSHGLQIALDGALLSATFLLAFLVRFDFSLRHVLDYNFLRLLPLVVAVKVGSYAAWGVYRFIWRYIALGDMRAFAGGAVTSALLLLLVRVGPAELLAGWQVPASVIVMDCALGLFATLGARIVRRAALERNGRGFIARRGAPPARQVRTLLVGAGRAGVLVSREIAANGKFDVRGFVDDDDAKLGSVVNGVPVIGKPADIPRLVEALQIETVILSIARASGREIRRILEHCEACGVRTRIIPGIGELLGGQVTVSSLRDVHLEDLLGREPVHLEEQPIREFLSRRRVLVTGAGGSIGSELVRQVARFEPAQLLLLERSEYALYQIDDEVRRRFPDIPVRAILADVRDAARLRSFFRESAPEVVIHAAAHKHVPIAEENAGEVASNNIFGTMTLAEISGEFGVRTFLFISTDKAVNPTSVMGATKRAAELAIQMLKETCATTFVTVRFGNVVDSAGSVIPRFREQIRRGGPVTVTHPDMWRYFMTIPEAAQLVLQAASFGTGGEIFVLDLGKPVRILDLAKDLIRLSGLRANEDIEILFTGVRPGEKLFENPGLGRDQAESTSHPKVFVGRVSEMPREVVAASLARLARLCGHHDDRAIRAELLTLIPEAKLLASQRGENSESALETIAPTLS